MDDLIDYLRTVIVDMRNPEQVRRRAEALLHKCKRGIVPGRGSILALRKEVGVDIPCKRLNSDGSCVWLRKNAKRVGLKPPEPGERAYCLRKNEGPESNTFAACLGYVKDKLSE